MEQSQRIEIWMYHGTPQDRQTAMRDVFQAEGIPAEVREKEPTGVGNGAWQVEVWLLGVTIGAFLAGYFGAAGKDAYEGTKRFVRKVKRTFLEGVEYEGSSYEDGALLLRHPESGAAVYVPSNMSDRGYRELHELEFEPETVYMWDGGEWQGYKSGEHLRKPTIRSRLRNLRYRLFRR